MSAGGNLPAWLPVAVGFLLGAIFLRGVDKVLPHLHLGFATEEAEGIKMSWRRSTLLILAVTLHNIPEGIAVSVPIFYATGSRRRAFLTSFSSGLAEPVGALIGYAILLPFLTPTLLSTLLAFVAGIMVYISLDELLPLAHRYGQEHLVIIGVGAGMLVMAASLFLLL